MTLPKLDNGMTLVELGKGKVLTGVVHNQADEYPVGMFIKDKDDKENNNGIVITLSDMSSYASYFMGALRVLESQIQHEYYKEEYGDKVLDVMKEILSLKELFEPFMPGKGDDLND